MPEETPTYQFDRSKLSLTYDVARLQQETLQVIQQQPPYIYYNVLPLTTPGGRNANTTFTDFASPDWTIWEKTSLLKNSCPYMQEILDSLQCQKTNVRILRLEPGAVIKEHVDMQLNLDFQNQIRLHVPIFTSELVEFMLNGLAVPLHPGELWYLRLSDPHSVHNNSQTERIHLSIDVVVNEWVETMILQGDIPQDS